VSIAVSNAPTIQLLHASGAPADLVAEFALGCEEEGVPMRTAIADGDASSLARAPASIRPDALHSTTSDSATERLSSTALPRHHMTPGSSVSLPGDVFEAVHCLMLWLATTSRSH
jgi:hypothetical protein